MKNLESLAEEKISKLIIKYSIPAILSMLITSLYNIVDRVFIGSINGVGGLAIAGLGVTMPIFTLIVSFGVLISMGATTNIAIKLGEGNHEEAEKYLGNAVLFSVIISIFIMIIGLNFINPILNVFGASYDTIIYAREYISVILLGSVTCITGFTLNNIIRVDGNPKFAAKTMILGCLINIILDPIFIFKFNMGIKGAAIATVLTQVIIFAILIYYFLSEKSTIKIRRYNLKLDFKIIRKIIILGISPFIMELATSFVSLIMNNYLKIYGGDLAIGAMTIMSSIMQIVLLPLVGLSQGAQPIISYNYGAKEGNRVKQTFRLLFTYCLCYTGVMWIALMMAPGFFVSIFNDNSNLMDITTWSIKIFFGGVIASGAQIACQQTFLALGQAKTSLILALLRKIILLIPLALILPMIFENKLKWTLMAEPIADITAATITVICFVSFYKKKLSEDALGSDNVSKS